MKKYEVNKDNFLKDVAKHELTVVQDNGVYRHITVKEPGTICQSYNIVTYPGYLVYSGDMGTFVFSRSFDMFDFFNDHIGDGINPYYWMEKVQATDRNGGCMRHEPDKVLEIVETYLTNFCEDIDDHYNNASESVKEECPTEELFKAKIEKEVRTYFASRDLDEYRFCIAFDDWDNEKSELCQDLSFDDWYEYQTKEYTTRYLWCCYAIVHAIQQYKSLPKKNLAQRFIQYIKGFKK